MKLFFAIAALLVACNTPSPGPSPSPPGPTPPTPADSGPPSSTCAQACAALAAASCPMGSDASCPPFLQTLNDKKKQPNPSNGNKPLTCDDVVKVKTKADAVALGFVCQ